MEGVYRCIGWECARHYIGEAQTNAADRDYYRKQKFDGDLEFAFSNIRSIPAMIHYLTCLLTLAEYAERLVRLVGRSHVRSILIGAVRGNHGRLKG